MKEGDVVKKKGCCIYISIAIVMMVISFIIFFYNDILDQENYFEFIIVIVLFSVICVLILLKMKFGFIEQYLIYVCFLISPAMVFILGEFINDNYFAIGLNNRILNYIFLLTFFLVVRLVIPKFFVAVTVSNLLLLGWSTANMFVVKFRGKPILPWDITAYSTAIKVMRGYDIRFTKRVALSLVLVLIWAFLLKKIEAVSKKIRYKMFIPIVVLSITMLTILSLNSRQFKDLNVYMWDTDIVNIYRTQGMVASFIKYADAMKVNPPAEYSISQIKQWVETYEGKKSSKGIQPQNVIMIMNESLADMQVLGTKFSESFMPFWDSLRENTIKGDLYVSVRGGSTCNTEYESLTGNSLVFLPSGSFPFESYINHESYSLASYFKNRGYITEALHFEAASNWKRDKVYPYLGFQKFYTIDDFEEEETLRWRVTDSANYKELIRLYEKNRGEKQFIYNITIQNHGGYDPNRDLANTVDLSQYGDFPTAELYFSLLKLSDQAIKELIDYFEMVEEPTMIIVYGDHQPNLGPEVDEWLMKGGVDNQKSHLNKYITRFLIWTNYDIDEKKIDKVSANFIPSIILEAGNFELPVYNQFLLDVYSEYPVMTLAGILDSQGNYYSDISLIDDSNGVLQRYSQIQYNIMFDQKNELTKLFEIK